MCCNFSSAKKWYRWDAEIARQMVPRQEWQLRVLECRADGALTQARAAISREKYKFTMEDSATAVLHLVQYEVINFDDHLSWALVWSVWGRQLMIIDQRVPLKEQSLIKYFQQSNWVKPLLLVACILSGIRRPNICTRHHC